MVDVDDFISYIDEKLPKSYWVDMKAVMGGNSIQKEYLLSKLSSILFKTS